MTEPRKKPTRKRRRAREQQAAERLRERLEGRRFEKDIARWLTQAPSDGHADAPPPWLDEALEQAAGTPLESLARELQTLTASESAGSLEDTIARMDDWLDRFDRALDALSPSPETAHAED